MQVTVRCVSHRVVSEIARSVPRLELRAEDLTTELDLQGFAWLADDSDCTSSGLKDGSLCAHVPKEYSPTRTAL